MHNRTDHHQNYFLYFGHEIPSENGTGYHLSIPGIDVNTVSFANGIQNFLFADEDRFDLVVLSTCNNGTPAMAELLVPFTKAMLGSFTAATNVSDRSLQFKDNVDCVELLLLDPESYSKGVVTWYKPSRFGRPSDQLIHSGWGCKP
jgi:hypothetical protein